MTGGVRVERDGAVTTVIMNRPEARNAVNGPAAAELYVHEHTLSYRLKRIEQLTGRSLKTYRDTFELWLAVEMSYLVNE